MATGFGGGTATTNKPKPKIVKINLPDDKPKSPPKGKTGGLGSVPVVGTAAMAPPKVKSVNQMPVNPNPTAGGSMVAGPGPTAQGLSSQSITPASTGGGDRVQQNQQGSLNTGTFMNPMSGFASRYDPAQLDALYSNPGMILEDVFKDQGLPMSNSRLAGMGDYADRMYNLAGLISLSGGGDAQDEALINTIAELLGNGMGAGGASVDMMTALEALMNPEGGGALQKYLYGAPGDTGFGLSQQDSALQPLFMAAINGVNPFTQQAMASAYRGATNLASQDLAKGTTGNPTITQYLRNNLRGVVPGSIL